MNGVSPLSSGPVYADSALLLIFRWALDVIDDYDFCGIFRKSSGVGWSARIVTTANAGFAAA